MAGVARFEFMHSVLITGAGRGIGLALARHYRAAGWRVYACHRQASAELERIADDNLSLHALDVAEPEQMARLADSLSGLPLDVLFNNAGVYGPSVDGFGSLDAEGLLDTLRVNTVAPLLLAQALLPNLHAGALKTIATLTSRMGSIGDNGSGGHYPYRASKAGLNAALRSLSIDLRPHDIKVLILHPGWVRTDMGGAHGTLSVEQSAAQLFRHVASAQMRDSGRFIDIDGSKLPW
ncbi:SDR family oxidoreductase [Acidihalobacter prosperus]|uniref:SDR family oxidoreductase n=1 Tax=Acidihalobacter prosperus TaxID=160660 RepID=UPI00191C2FBB|nr:SDR family oxidoreductase [Acidihalobacter prosperus]